MDSKNKSCRFRTLALVTLLGACLLFSAATSAAQSTNTPPKINLGQVIERQLRTAWDAADDRVLNLDTGELLSVPANIITSSLNNPRPLLNWMVKHGSDLVAGGHSVDTVNLHVDDGRILLFETNSSFHSITASEVAHRFAKPGGQQNLRIRYPETQPSAVLAFKTREGGFGVLQVVGFKREPSPVINIRYRLLGTLKAP